MQPIKLTRGTLAAIVIGVVIILDQIIKIWIKTHFYLGEDLVITSWFHLLFVENNGMAFGMELGPKIFLTLFRLLLASALIWYICKIHRAPKATTGYLVCLSLIAAGAIGNILDCILYGVIFNNPMPPEIAQIFPPEGGYAPMFQGLVVDMFYFPLFSFVWPQWMPWVGGETFEFFKPVFNLADAAISVGIIVLILFYSRQLASPSFLNQPSSDQESTDGQ